MPVCCPKCKCQFQDNHAVTKHLNGKRKCDAGKHQCAKCPKRFTEASNRSRHQAKCKGLTPSKNEAFKQLQEQVASLQDQIEHIHTVHHTTIHDRSVHYNIQINVVGQEDKKIFETMTIEELMASVQFLPSQQTYWNYAQILRCNPAAPQNHNVTTSSEGDVYLRRTMTTASNSLVDKWGKLSSDDGMNRLLMEDTEGLQQLCERVEGVYDTTSFREFNTDGTQALQV